MTYDNRSAIDITDPSVFTKNLEKIYSDKGIEGFSDWVKNELSQGRKVKMVNSSGTSEEKIIFDRSINTLESNKPVKNLLPFEHEPNAETSSLLGVYNINGKNGDIQLVIRAYPVDPSNNTPIKPNK